MKDIALQALDAVARRGVTYADVRACDQRERELATKNGKIAHAGTAESFGVGIRVLAEGGWGFASACSTHQHGAPVQEVGFAGEVLSVVQMAAKDCAWADRDRSGFGLSLFLPQN